MDLLLDIWPTRAAIAKDLGLPVQTVISWGAAGRCIPAARYGMLIKAAAKLGRVVTFDDLERANRGEWVAADVGA